MASEICKSMKLDGQLEGTVPPQAILTCLAGHLAKVPSLVSLGMEMAARVEGVVHNILRDYKLPSSTMLNMADISSRGTYPQHNTAAPLYDNYEKTIYAATRNDPRPPNQLSAANHYNPSSKVSTTRVLGSINGRPTECVVDTGATTTAITVDCCRRNGMTDLIQSDHKAAYLNADGRLAAGKGKVPNTIFGLGGFETLVNPTVTNALNYDVLIGTDVLKRAKAIIDFGRETII
jgi:hypothetical protein